MEILAHRGIWMEAESKNTEQALKKALIEGFGVETDIRDYKGELVISHNIADENSFLLEDYFIFYLKHKFHHTLALNIKADGLQDKLCEMLSCYQIDTYFLFDMSIPELVVNDRMGLNYYTRKSDIEDTAVLYDRACGVWLDSFYQKGWISKQEIQKHLEAGKQLCIVSPELHGNSERKVWEMLKYERFFENDLIRLCTDYPMKARRFFYGHD